MDTNEICEAIEFSAKNIHDFCKQLTHITRFQSSLRPGIKSGSINDLSQMIERARNLEAAVEESSKRFSSKNVIPYLSMISIML